MDRIYKQKETKSAKALRNQFIGIHLRFLRYLLLEDKRFADDRALLVGVICACRAVGRRGNRRRVIRRQIFISAFPRRDFGNADRCVVGRTLDRA